MVTGLRIFYIIKSATFALYEEKLMYKVLHRSNRLWCNHHGTVRFTNEKRQVYSDSANVRHEVLTDQDLLKRATIVGCKQVGADQKPCTKIIAISTGRGSDVVLGNEIPILSNLQADTDGNPAGTVKYDEILDALEKNEGRTYEAYDDGRGNITIGVGTLLKHHDGTEYRNKIAGLKKDGRDLDFDDLIVLGQTNTVDDTHIDVMRDRDIADARSGARRNVDRFDELDSARQNVLTEIVYNRGEGTFAKMKAFRDAVNARDWEKAASLLETNDSYRSYIKGRLDEFAKIIRGRRVYGTE